MKKYSLRLYVTGRTSHSMRAIQNLRQICDDVLKGEYEVEVIDVLENPGLAEDEKIIATPTLVKHLPEPVRKIIGDLSDRGRVLLGLDLIPANMELNKNGMLEVKSASGEGKNE